MFNHLSIILSTLLIASSVHAAKTPNVIVILGDDIGYGDFGCYGSTKIKTPNIDALASGGMRFTNAYATASTCTPTRYALLTGRYAWRQSGTGILSGVAPTGIGTTASRATRPSPPTRRPPPLLSAPP